MSSRILDDKSLVTDDSRKHLRFFYSPFADIGPVLFSLRILLLSVRRGPSRFPVIGELFEKRGFQVGRLEESA